MCSSYDAVAIKSTERGLKNLGWVPVSSVYELCGYGKIPLLFCLGFCICTKGDSDPHLTELLENHVSRENSL